MCCLRGEEAGARALHPTRTVPKCRSVRTFAEAFKALGTPLHVLALNAGTFEGRYRRCAPSCWAGAGQGCRAAIGRKMDLGSAGRARASDIATKCAVLLTRLPPLPCPCSSPDGFEQSIATSFLGHLYLSHLLLPELQGGWVLGGWVGGWGVPPAWPHARIRSCTLTTPTPPLCHPAAPAAATPSRLIWQASALEQLGSVPWGDLG